jgi:hypothetical protein
MESTFSPSAHPAHLHSLKDAFVRVQPEIIAVLESELVAINLDPGAKFTSTLGYLPRLVTLRGAIVTLVPSFNVKQFDSLCDYLMAMMYTHVQYQNALKPESPVQEVASKVTLQRDLLLPDCMALANRGLLPAERVGQLKASVGYRATGELVLSMVDMLRTHWERINGKTAITAQELAECEASALELLNAVGVREGALPTAAEAALTRQRAYTLFVRAYEEARRHVIFLRWHEGDADNFAPSLFAGRSNGRRKQEDEETPSGNQAGSAAPAPATPSAAVSEQAGAQQPAPGVGPSNNPFA